MSEEKSGWTLDDMNKLYLERAREEAEENNGGKNDRKCKEKDVRKNEKNQVENKKKK